MKKKIFWETPAVIAAFVVTIFMAAWIIRGDVAADIAALRAEMRGEIRDLRIEQDGKDRELQGEVRDLRLDFHQHTNEPHTQ